MKDAADSPAPPKPADGAAAAASDKLARAVFLGVMAFIVAFTVPVIAFVLR